MPWYDPAEDDPMLHLEYVGPAILRFWDRSDFVALGQRRYSADRYGRTIIFSLKVDEATTGENKRAMPDSGWVTPKSIQSAVNIALDDDTRQFRNCMAEAVGTPPPIMEDGFEVLLRDLEI